ncbi:MAG: restriction endonuclease subunit S [Mesorhizobium sp.]|nr:MAG: restriction endonuclease subunit S [Mesorhizobium sp.]RWM50924.1 MAG: restriction endonuclease subunit S [Mesorhizobium sp.]RWM57623.1 MAG: restriction endonuclease subunit S [Mesorhizobium sp.]RWM59146.1 MAG: restriction endonuclease subunit S [Mesorhizobium sp.]RWM99886.1 MAG: restriction endonuclease subunit S [Mesorhizobium sp.]
MAYPSYRPSKVEWLGALPEHWSVRRIKETSYLKARVGWKGLTSDEFMDSGFAYLVTGTDFRAKFIDWSDCYCVDRDRYDDDPFIQLENGDLLITKDGTIGKLAIVTKLEKPACLNSGIFVVRPIKAYITSYLYWVLSSPNFTHFCDLGSYGSTIQHLYQNVFENFSFPIPPIKEQVAIAAFLDRETGKIDALVEDQKRLVELLKEKRQAVISHSVTKGLNPNVPMKASGVEWLGDVPEHWDVSPLMRLTADGRNIMYGIVLPGPNVDEGVPIVKGGDVRPHRLTLDLLNRTTAEIEAPFARARLRPKDIVYSIRGSIGDAELVPDELLDANITQDVARVSPRPDLNCRWLLYALKSIAIFVQLEQRSLGAAVRGINIFDLKRARVPLPTPSEQDEIATFLDRQTLTIDGLLSEASSAIDLLTERRAALISAAVTGKIDVRRLEEVELKLNAKEAAFA